MESTRQQKVGKQIQKDLGEIMIKEVSHLYKGALITVSQVRMSPDLAVAKVYLSIFPFDKSQPILNAIEENKWLIRKSLGTRIKDQLKAVPELVFVLDDTLEYIENIDKVLKGSQ